jgi:type VI secretion system protein ImpG
MQTQDTRSVLRLSLRTTSGLPFSALFEKLAEGEPRAFDRLRFYLQGEGQLVYALYELLFVNAIKVELLPADAKKKSAGRVVLNPDCLRPVGFDREEGILPYSDRSFLAYRLLHEYFTFPEKYLFFDLCELSKASGPAFGDRMDVLVHFNRDFSQERGVTPQTFRLNCTPIVNLFRQVAEPIRLTHRQTEYRVVPDVGRQTATEVYSVDSVTCAASYNEKPIPYQPFYSFRHATDRETQRTFWFSHRRPSSRRDDLGTDVYLSLVDLDFQPARPGTETLTVVTTCTNRDLPGRLPFGNPEGDFQLEGPGLFTSIRCLKKPTATIRPPMRRATQWRLISHLALNYLSLVEKEGESGPEALREILRIYDFTDSSATRRQISGITAVSARRIFRSIPSPFGASFVRGVEVSLTMDEQQYVGSGAFLMASVLERFLALYTSINSFVQTVAKTQQREGELKRWPPRAGEQIVL